MFRAVTGVAALLAAPVIAVASAGTAAAGEAEFVSALQDRFVFLTPQQIRTEGHRICAAMGRGTAASDIVPMVQKDLGVSVPAAAEIIEKAVIELGC